MHVQAVYAVTEPNPGGVNEDAYRVGPDWVLVLDGAGRYPGHTGGCMHPVTWVVDRLAEHLARGLATDHKLSNVVRAAISATVEDHGPACDPSDPLSPGATLAVVRVGGGQVQWLVLGDCAVVIEHRDGRHTAVIDDRVDHLPDAPVNDAAVRTYLPEYVKTKRNRPGGFWMASTVPEAADNALTGHVLQGDVVQVLVCSDGITRLTERYGWSWQRAFTVAVTSGPKGLVTAVREAENADPDPRRWRGKRHDDATAILWQLA